MKLQIMAIRYRFFLSVGCIAAAFITAGGCVDTMTVYGSEPVRILVRDDVTTIKSDEYWTEINGVRIHVDVINDVTLSSQAWFSGIKIEGSGIGHRELGSSPFVIGMTFNLEGKAKFFAENPLLIVNGNIIEGHARTPVLPDDPLLDCIDQVNGKFEAVNPREVSKKFCIRYEFPIDPVHPDKAFSVDFGVLEIKGERYSLQVEFEGVKRTIRTSL